MFHVPLLHVKFNNGMDTYANCKQKKIHNVFRISKNKNNLFKTSIIPGDPYSINNINVAHNFLHNTCTCI